MIITLNRKRSVFDLHLGELFAFDSKQIACNFEENFKANATSNEQRAMSNEKIRIEHLNMKFVIKHVCIHKISE